MSDDMIERARRIVTGECAVPNVGCCPAWAEALLAEYERAEQAERERDEAARFGELTQDWLRARVAELEAALRYAIRSLGHVRANPTVHDGLREAIRIDEANLRAALGEQEAQ